MRSVLLTIMAMFIVAPLYAADIEFDKAIDAKTPERLQIRLDRLSDIGVIPYKVDKKALNTKARGTFERSPAAKDVRAKKMSERENEKAITFLAGSVQYEFSKTTGAEILMDLDQYTHSAKLARPVKEGDLRARAKKYIQTYMPDVDQREVSFAGIKKIMNSVGKLSNEGKDATDIATEVANYIAIFERKINNVPVIGAGEKIRVYMSSNGDIIGHSKVWRTLEREQKGPKPAVSSDKIKDKFREKHSKDLVQSIKVDSLYFGYFAHGRYRAQDVLRPVYMIGYTSGPESKRVFEMYDAYTGEEIREERHVDEGDKR